jgi:hypothetical protein
MKLDKEYALNNDINNAKRMTLLQDGKKADHMKFATKYL